jgi:hypothetical protein
VKRLSVKCARTLQPRTIVEADDINDQRVSFPPSDGISHVGRDDVVGMFGVQRDVAERIHILIQNGDLLRGLNELDRKQTLRCGSCGTWRQTQIHRIVDAPLLIGLQYFLCSPRLIWRRFTRRPFRRGSNAGPIRIGSVAAEAQSRIRFFPGTAHAASALPHTRQVRLAVRCARDGFLCRCVHFGLRRLGRQ